MLSVLPVLCFPRPLPGSHPCCFIIRAPLLSLGRGVLRPLSRFLRSFFLIAFLLSGPGSPESPSACPINKIGTGSPESPSCGGGVVGAAASLVVGMRPTPLAISSALSSVSTSSAMTMVSSPIVSSYHIKLNAQSAYSLHETRSLRFEQPADGDGNNSSYTCRLSLRDEI